MQPAAARSDPRRDPLAGRLPVTVITGFLGSGKTTLLKKLLAHPGMNRVAVIINELGEIGIDHDLVAMSSENMTLLANGCLCCAVRTDLQETLRELFVKRRAGEIVDFDRVVVETTGLADPAPVVQTLATDTMLSAQYRLDGIVTLVDAVNAPGQLDRQPEAVKQVALADRLLVTKTDLTTSDDVRALKERLAQINPQAETRDVLMGDVDPAFLLDLGLRNARGEAAAVTRFLGPLVGEGTPPDAPRYLGERLGPRHDSAIRTFVLRFDTPFAWSAFSGAMDMLASLRGPDLLRVKGLVNVEGAPVVVQGVQHIFHPAVTLEQWPSEDHSTRLVFITRNIEKNAVEAAFVAATALVSDRHA